MLPAAGPSELICWPQPSHPCRWPSPWPPCGGGSYGVGCQKREEPAVHPLQGRPTSYTYSSFTKILVNVRAMIMMIIRNSASKIFKFSKIMTAGMKSAFGVSYHAGLHGAAWGARLAARRSITKVSPSPRRPPCFRWTPPGRGSCRSWPCAWAGSRSPPARGRGASP